MIKLAFAVSVAVAGFAIAAPASSASGTSAAGLSGIAGLSDTISISQTEDTTPVAGNSFACGQQKPPHLYTRENHYWRRFYFSDYPEVAAFARVVSIDLGVEQTNGQDLAVNLYVTPDNVPAETIDRAQLFFIGNAAFAVPAGTELASVNVPVRGDIIDTATTNLVVEVVAPDGSGDDTVFYIGSTPSPETHVSFFSSAFCDVLEPVPTAEIGAPDMHIIMTVHLVGDAIFADGFDSAP
ncbi:MAG TPA: hypothetical protein VFG55_07970 [Rhodanobacteraceae bacterium]|nr:hypothetical protein [Rhodanobacteraceae bacterium]